MRLVSYGVRRRRVRLEEGGGMEMEEVIVNGEKAGVTGNRHVVVVDRGWIFAGDLHEENGRIRLTRAVWVFRWEGVGFDGMLSDPNSRHVQIRRLHNDVDIPADAEVFRIPVGESWGL
jgi:hypothetical protein